MFNIRKIKISLRWVFTAVLLMLVLLPASAFSTMVGPYTGQVLDSLTGEPIQGASVLINWDRSIPTPAGSISELIKITLAYTDDHGTYKIPRQFLNVGLIAGLDSTNLIIYQPGYQVSMNVSWEGDLPTPIKTNAIVKLKRIPPNFDHKKHYEKIIDAIRMGETHIIPPIDYHPFSKGDTRMTWSKFIDKALLSAPADEFLRRVEWEKRRE